MVGLGSGLF